MKEKLDISQEQSSRTEKQPDNITLIRASYADLPLLYAITQAGMAKVNKDSNPRDFTQEEKNEHYKKYVTEFENKLDETFLIHSNGLVLGRLRVEELEESIHIGGIQLLPEHQSKGIGGNIIETLKQKKKKITLMVHKVNNKAISFYKKHNFKSTRETTTQIEMEWSVDN